MCGSAGIQRGIYSSGETIGRAEFEVRVGNSRMEKPQVRMRSQGK